MARFSPKTKKYFRYALSGLLFTGMVFVTGFLSFSGMLVINDSIYLAIAAFFLAGGIEGQVYARNINDSLIKIISDNYLVDALICKKLAELLERYPNPDQRPAFLNDYQKQLLYTQEVEHSNNEDYNQELAKATRRLKWMRRYFKDFMLGNPQGLIYRPFDEALAKVVSPQDKEQLQIEISRKKWLGRLSWILNAGAGISCCLVGLEVAQSSLLVIATHFGFVISGAALSASVFGLAFVGALGYTLMIHNTINNMIHNDTLQKWYYKTIDFFALKKDPEIGFEEKTLHYFLRACGGALLVVLVASLAIFATVATAGTWWYAAKAGAEMISWVRNFASSLRSVAVITMGLTSMVFTLVNSLKTAEKLTTLSVRTAWRKFRDKIDSYERAENFWQLINPPRILIEIIRLPFKLLSFLAHLMAMSVMNDRLAGVPPIVTATVGTTSEALTDAGYIFDLDHAASEEKHSHPCHAPSHGHTHGHSINPPHKHKHSHHHNVDDDHDHSHVDIAGFLLKVALSPVYLLAAGWDYYHSKKNISNPTKPQLTPWKAVRKSFLGLPKKVEKPELSNTWRDTEKGLVIQKMYLKHTGHHYQPQQQHNSGINALMQQVLPSQMPKKPDEPEKAEKATQPLCYIHSNGTINTELFWNTQKAHLTKEDYSFCETVIKKVQSLGFQ